MTNSTISKELLSVVLGWHECDDSVISENEVIGKRDTFFVSEYHVNIYELAHKCKEWSRMYRYDLCTWVTFDKSRCSVFDSNTNSWDDVITTFESETEPEAIFKACQWILDNKDKQ